MVHERPEALAPLGLHAAASVSQASASLAIAWPNMAADDAGVGVHGAPTYPTHGVLLCIPHVGREVDPVAKDRVPRASHAEVVPQDICDEKRQKTEDRRRI